MAKEKHRPAFFRAGGVDQLVLRSGADIAGIVDLDQKLWVALACPTHGIGIDEKLLEMLDTDHDGRIRPPEVKEAVTWAGKVFKSLDLLLEKGDAVPLSSFDGADPDGKAVLSGAKRILRDRSKADAKEITLDDVVAMTELFKETRLNGDGVVPVDSAESEELKAAVTDVMSAMGSLSDRSGKEGIDKTKVEDFFKQAKEMLAWDDAGNADGVRALGDATEAAADAVAAVADKIDDYFTRCRIAAFDARGAAQMAASDAELAALSPMALSDKSADVAKLPLGKVEANRALPLDAGLNPAWSERIATFADKALKPVLGAKPSLTEGDWRAVTAKVDAFRAWRGTKPSHPAGTLATDRLRALVEGGFEDKLLELIAEDAALETEYAALANVEKAIRFRVSLARFLRNFVSFADFYGGRRATFQAGHLFLDARSCDLVLFVADAAKHAKLAGLSSAYLVYCDIVRGADKKGIVAAYTAGDTDNLMVGRNGVFYDNDGKDWDATITSIVENPISIRQAFWTPYKRLVRLVEEQVAKRAADKEKESSADVDAMAAKTANADAAAPAAAGAPAPGPAKPGAPTPEKKVDVGMVAAISVAVAGIGTFLGLIFATFVDMGYWLPLGLLALMLAISAPSMLIAWLKLRKRNLGPILDANGWAVNALAKINVPFGTSLTHLRKLPEGATRALDDPYAEKRTPWKLYLFLFVVAALAIAWLVGRLDPYLPTAGKAATVLHRGAASAAPSAAPAPGAGSAAPAAPAK